MDDLYVDDDVFEDQDEDMDNEDSGDDAEASQPVENGIHVESSDEQLADYNQDANGDMNADPDPDPDPDELASDASQLSPGNKGKSQNTKRNALIISTADNNESTRSDASAKKASATPVVAGLYRKSHPLWAHEPMVRASTYDLTPTTLFMHGGPVHSLGLSWGAQFLVTGGEDGYIRRYDFAASVAGKSLLAMGQRNASVDTITKSGVLISYWENEQPYFKGEVDIAADGTYAPDLSPVYSLALQSESLWLCAGLKSGGINVQTVRYGEGRTQAYLDGHTSVVSELLLDYDETRLLSGSWDRSMLLWDLNTGSQISKYTLSGQLSAMAWQPAGGPPPAADPASAAAMTGRADNVTARDDDDDNQDDAKSLGSLFGSDEDMDKQDSGERPPSPGSRNADQPGDESEAKTNDLQSSPGGKQPDRQQFEGNVFASASITGVLELWDLRLPKRASILGKGTAPPWTLSASWSICGKHLFTGRRNATVDQYDIRKPNSPMRTLKFPSISGAVTCVTPLPNNRHIACASLDNIRLFDLESQGRTPFEIVPGHHGAHISRLLLDPTAQYLVAAASGRGWEDTTTDAVLAFEIAPILANRGDTQ